MNKTKKSADSSEDSDRDYAPPTKRSKSTNSIDREDVSESEQISTAVEGAGIDSIWKELKESVDPLGLRSDKKAFEIVESVEDKKSPKKSRLSRLLKTRTDKKREKPASILSSSKLEWEGLKAREELSEELSHHNKDGFLQRQEFLKRCEEREHDSLLESRAKQKK